MCNKKKMITKRSKFIEMENALTNEKVPRAKAVTTAEAFDNFPLASGRIFLNGCNRSFSISVKSLKI